MTTLTMFQVDAFTSKVFAGNPAAVLVLEDWLEDPVLQAIAQENNLAETAFVRRSGDSWDLRWFTPVHEVDFCGHATLATAHTLFEQYSTEGTLRFETRVGRLVVERKVPGYAMHIPTFAPEPLGADDPDLVEITGTHPVETFRNFENFYAVMPSPEALRVFEPDLAKIATLFPCGLCITSQGDCSDILSRYFAPGAGIPEDPVTGSTHATLVPYWAGRLGRTRLTAHQASPRGGDLKCTLDGDRVILEGNCVTFMKAEVYLPA
ncbi:MAG: PhzF family phenazine biosynthesis protein [Pseudomonadota bacterium]